MFRKMTFVIFVLLCIMGNGCINNGISIEEDEKLSPSHPTEVTVEIKGNGILLGWLGTGDDRIQYYQIYRKIPNKDWQSIMRVEVDGENRDRYSFLDESIEKGVVYMYGISAVNGYGKESTISESSSIVIP